MARLKSVTLYNLVDCHFLHRRLTLFFFFFWLNNIIILLDVSKTL